MCYLVIFDISNNKKRRVVTKYLKRKGARVHRSVFMCDIDPRDITKVVSAIGYVIDEEKDSVRFYPQCEWDHAMVKSIGEFEFESLCDNSAANIVI